MVVGDQGADGVLGHGEQEVSILNLGVTTGDPVVFAGIAQVLAVVSNAVEVLPVLVGLALANRFRGTGVEREGHERIASAQAVSARTTLAVH